MHGWQKRFRYWLLDRRSNIESYLFIALLLLCLAPTQAQAGTISKPSTYNLGLVGYYNFELGKGGNITYDMGSGRNNGVLTNMGGGEDWVQGRVGQALDFDGTNDIVNLATSTNDTSDSTFSYSVWVKTATAFAGLPFVEFQANDSCGATNGVLNGYLADPYTAVQLSVWTNAVAVMQHSGNQAPYIATYVATLSGWTHVAIVSNSSSDLRLYVNGIERDSAPFYGRTRALNLSGIGAQGACGNKYFNGQIDDVRVYNRAISPADVARLYNTSAPKYNASSVGQVANGLVAHWTFDGNDTVWTSGTVGSAVDRSGSNNQGTFTNMNRNTALVPGKSGQALSLMGSTDYVTAGNPASLQITGSVTLSAWINPRAVATQYERVVVKNTSGNYPPYICYGFNRDLPTQGIAFSISTGGVLSTSALPLNTWTHVVGVYDGSQAKIYINGVLNNSATSSGALCDTSSALVLGFNIETGTTENFMGYLDDVRIYNRAISVDEVKRLYEIGTPSKISTTPENKGNLAQGLVGHWTFDGPDISWQTQKAHDKSGQGNTGTLINMSTTSSPTYGRLGQALKFNGTTQYVDAGTNSSLNLLADLSVCAWTYRTGTGITMQVISRGHSSPITQYQMFVDTSNKMNWNTYPGNPQGVTANTTTVVRTWEHWCGVHEGILWKLYRNGVLDNTASNATAITDTTRKVEIGAVATDAAGTPTQLWLGLLDDARIYNRALSAEEVKQLYNMGR